MIHSEAMRTVGVLDTVESSAVASFERLYDDHLAFVWRSVRRLGVPLPLVDDVVQDVFVIAYRRLGTFEQRSSIKTWLFGILRRVVRDRLRSHRRVRALELEAPDEILDASSATPHDEMERREAEKLVHRLLAVLDESKREVFVLAELEDMSAPEIAEATGANVNTVYARLRAARHEVRLAYSRRQSNLRRAE